MGPDPAPRDAQAFIAALDEVDLARYRVVGTYTRYEEAVRNALQDARQKILAGFEPPGRKRENHLIWAAPGTGKTYFVQQIAASLGDGVRYHEVNLAKCTEAEFRAALARLESGQASLCLIDEVDAKPKEPWPYEVLLPYLDAAVERGARFVFVLAGSSGTSLDDIKQQIAARPKGTDLLSRIPTGHEHMIGPMSLGDRLLIVLSQLRQAGQERGRDIRAIEKLGLYYVAVNDRLANARQLREFAVRAVERVPKTDHRVKYDHLFVPGDPENKTFWAQASPVAERLGNSFVTLAGERVDAPPEAPARTNLPRQLTSFVGREREIEDVKRLLSSTGLLTLNGPGGCGKTRLALRVAGDLVGQYPDGVWVAELAALSDPALVPRAVATALDVPEQPGRSLTETLREAIRPKSLLLVLDNCEHVAGACAELANTLLRACSTLRILATSRERLGIPGEIVWGVPSLSVPDPTQLPSPDRLVEHEATRLFLERATSSRPGFAITGRNAAAVAQVCTQLDGIPLAIELAAARVKVLTVEQIAARLDDRFRLLVGDARTTLPRHQTLRATMDWSYGLLSGRERAVLRRVSVFAGGWTLEAAEAICADVESSQVLDLLTHLVDRSLVIAEPRGAEVRYRLLETIRQYGRDRLQESGESAHVGGRHRDWYLELAELAEPKLRTAEQDLWMSSLEAEHDNLRSAIAWSLGENLEPKGETTAKTYAALRLVGALWWFWFIGGYWSEGRRWIEKTLAADEGTAPAQRARALLGRGVLTFNLGDFKSATAHLEESLQLSRAADDLLGQAWAAGWLGVLAIYGGDDDNAVTYFQASLALYRRLRDTWGVAWMTEAVGIALVPRGNVETAMPLIKESLALCREVGDKWVTALTLHNAAHLAIAQGDIEGATPLVEESLSLFRKLRARREIARALRNLGQIVLTRGDPQQAAILFRESLALSQEIGDKRGIAVCFERLGSVACAQGRFRYAAQLFGASDALRAAIGVVQAASGRAVYEFGGAEDHLAVRGKMGDDLFHAAWAEGRAMALEQAIEYALAGEAD